VQAKREMVRIVRTPDAGVQVDETGKRSGRGAYIHRNRACWEAALKKDRLVNALKTNLTQEEHAALQGYAAMLPESIDVTTEIGSN